MSQASCPREAVVLRAVRTGVWEEGLAAHVAKCAECGEVVQASHWMQALAQNSEKPMLPDASLLWWSAQLSERNEKAENAQEFFDWMEIISAIVIAAGLAGWIGWNWYAIQSTFISFVAEVWPQLWTTAGSVTDLTPIVLLLGAVIPSLIAIALTYPLAIRE
jgi:hypothetical protein